MEQKKNALQKLKRVKFALGNGFDLFCGLKTTYKDFFEACSNKYEPLKERLDHLADTFYQKRNEPDFRNPWNVYGLSKLKEHANCWDAFFAFIFSSMRGFLWCDIESEMLDSLKNTDAPDEDAFRPHWEDVFGYIVHDNTKYHNIGSLVLAGFVLEKAGKSFQTKDEFYGFLLEQLKEFELNFGHFITRQHVVINEQFDLVGFNNTYIDNAHKLLTHLSNPEEVVSIDSFNYGFTPEARFFEKCWFVNGDCLDPIFGVDSVFDSSDPRCIFTKTNRRIELDMNMSASHEMYDYENVIVFGHSLSSHDYNYFFPILDQLEMTNFLSRKKLVIAFSVYDSRKEFEIKRSVRRAVYSLFKAYARYCGRADENALRLLDSLTTQGRVITYEVPWEPAAPIDSFSGVDDIVSRFCGRDAISLRWSKYIEHGKSLKF